MCIAIYVFKFIKNERILMKVLTTITSGMGSEVDYKFYSYFNFISEHTIV